MLKQKNMVFKIEFLKIGTCIDLTWLLGATRNDGCCVGSSLRSDVYRSKLGAIPLSQSRTGKLNIELWTLFLIALIVTTVSKLPVDIQHLGKIA